MSSDLVITARGVGKTFELTRTERRATTLGELLVQKLRKPFTRRERTARFEALSDVSFDVRRGEVLGIIGRNGAGKSTLLKILSQITPPTRGEIDLYGRVGSLLEIGTGFHPELTGRENIYLNGAILGMSRGEINAAFDGIVAFSETEAFLDTPVKRYSSGMYVRLAFAVAAHLRPDILIVDEVLAVGDLAFQRKCLGKMESVAAEEGRTVLFVSHSMNSIAQICDSALCLEQGRVVRQGPKDEVIRHYLAGSGGDSGVCVLPALAEAAKQQKKVLFRRVALENSDGVRGGELDVRQAFHVCLTYEVPTPLTRIELSVRVLTAGGTPIFTTLRSDCSPDTLLGTQHGSYESRITIPGMLLMPGEYVINVAAHAPRGELYDLHEGILSFTIHDTGTNFSHYGDYASIGVIIQNLPWEEHALSAPAGS